MNITFVFIEEIPADVDDGDEMSAPHHQTR